MRYVREALVRLRGRGGDYFAEVDGRVDDLCDAAVSCRETLGADRVRVLPLPKAMQPPAIEDSAAAVLPLVDALLVEGGVSV